MITKKWCVYILTNKPNGVFIGITNNIKK
ncbi:GIY-YIG nuclease family protein [Lacinutrix cladophorae]